MNNTCQEALRVAEFEKRFESFMPSESLGGFRYNSSGRGWIAAAFVPLMFLAGIMILVETKKGRLVIESEVAGVHVTLLREGEVYDELKIEPGTNSMTLLAGQYKIVIEGAQDVSLLDGRKIEIKRGEVVVARVRPEVRQPTELVTERVEPIYDGKAIGEWLEIVAHEQSSAKVRSALIAVRSLMRTGNASMITTRLLEVMSTFSEDLAQSRAALEVSNQPSRGGTVQPTRYSSTIDELAFSIVRTANSHSDLANMLIRELERGQIDWQRRILRNVHAQVGADGAQELEALLRKHYPNTTLNIETNQKGCSVSGFVSSGDDVEHILALAGQYFQPVINRMTVASERSIPAGPKVTEEPLKSAASSASKHVLMPIAEWIEQKVIDAGRDDELLNVCAEYFWDLINHQLTDEAIKLQLLHKLVSCKALGPAFWLSIKRMSDTTNGWQYNGAPVVLFPAAKMEIEKRAMATLAKADTKSPFQIQAVIVLRQLFSKNSDRFGMDDTRDIILDLSKALLVRLGDSQEELLAADAIPNALLSSTALVGQINQQRRLELLRPSGELRQNIAWTIGGFSPAQSFLTVELLELIGTLDASAECSSDLLKLYMSTAELNEQLDAILDANPVNEVTWPGMVSRPASPATTDQWIAGVIRIRAFRLLPPETQAELTQLASRTFKSRTFESLLNKYDGNQDGVLSVQEVRGLDESIVNSDLNQDGILEVSELKELSTASNAPFEMLKTQKLDANNANLEWSRKKINQYDRNNDGKLTADEWRVMIIKPDGVDANGDGVITVQEYADSRSKR